MSSSDDTFEEEFAEEFELITLEDPFYNFPNAVANAAEAPNQELSRRFDMEPGDVYSEFKQILNHKFDKGFFTTWLDFFEKHFPQEKDFTPEIINNFITLLLDELNYKNLYNFEKGLGNNQKFIAELKQQQESLKIQALKRGNSAFYHFLEDLCDYGNPPNINDFKREQFFAEYQNLKSAELEQKVFATLHDICGKRARDRYKELEYCVYIINKRFLANYDGDGKEFGEYFVNFVLNGERSLRLAISKIKLFNISNESLVEFLGANHYIFNQSLLESNYSVAFLVLKYNDEVYATARQKSGSAACPAAYMPKCLEPKIERIQLKAKLIKNIDSIKVASDNVTSPSIYAPSKDDVQEKTYLETANALLTYQGELSPDEVSKKFEQDSFKKLCRYQSNLRQHYSNNLFLILLKICLKHNIDSLPSDIWKTYLSRFLRSNKKWDNVSVNAVLEVLLHWLSFSNVGVIKQVLGERFLKAINSKNLQRWERPIDIEIWKTRAFEQGNIAFYDFICAVTKTTIKLDSKTPKLAKLNANDVAGGSDPFYGKIFVQAARSGNVDLALAILRVKYFDIKLINLLALLDIDDEIFARLLARPESKFFVLRYGKALFYRALEIGYSYREKIYALMANEFMQSDNCIIQSDIDFKTAMKHFGADFVVWGVHKHIFVRKDIAHIILKDREGFSDTQIADLFRGASPQDTTASLYDENERRRDGLLYLWMQICLKYKLKINDKKLVEYCMKFTHGNRLYIDKHEIGTLMEFLCDNTRQENVESLRSIIYSSYYFRYPLFSFYRDKFAEQAQQNPALGQLMAEIPQDLENIPRDEYSGRKITEYNPNRSRGCIPSGGGGGHILFPGF